MNEADLAKLGCRHCRYYQPEGRRGGYCQLFGGAVRGIWSACSLGVPPFAPSWEAPEAIATGQPKLLQRQYPGQAIPPPSICSLLGQEGNKTRQAASGVQCPVPSESPQTVTAT